MESEEKAVAGEEVGTTADSLQACRDNESQLSDSAGRCQGDLERCARATSAKRLIECQQSEADLANQLAETQSHLEEAEASYEECARRFGR
ncbi:hypothetical protein CHLNCDRAFT_136613 [Chlorella variabilis]|uniref:Uncharacterized protein n=1 Tax=Chlorella variabilis TaxID=554065 RepID=E1ZKP3_CHLVA|nr:hypothetical protein CHLNCDRAFT_136613 [Chlorella variabilis]EFN53523.1 hypothetical protein CHLNCDRAFT_136613 [Chlorella variabilis]|eukprot:XP_005845625.1 hypothetical protein CHLNCDRAFT_136613 [Chlorella variabilis]